MNPLSVIIVNYRSGLILPNCLDNLFKSGLGLDFDVLVVNNDLASDLDHVRKRQWPRVSFIQSPSNLGFAAAVNRGIRSSRGEFILLINPDITVQPGSIQALLETMHSHPGAGIVMPLLRNPDGGLQYSCRCFYSFSTLLLRRSPLRWFYSNHPRVRKHLMLDWMHDSLAEVDWGLGAAMLLRRLAIEGCGLFDERFFLYFEDVDICLRMWRQDWKVLYNPASTMVHIHRRDSAGHWLHPAKWQHFLSLVKFVSKHKGKLGNKSTGDRG